MAFTTYPLNSVEYSAEDAELFHCTRSSGIYAGDDFQISVTGADRSITIGPGLGWIRNSKFSGKVVAQKESATLELGLSDATYPRIDAVVIRFSAADNRTNLVVKEGAAAAVPRSPVPERTEAVHELHLCNVRRPAGSTVVTAADVVDLRMDTYYCGLMADSVTQVDTEAIEAQINGMTKRLDSTISAVQAGAGFVAKTRIWRREGGSISPIEDFSVNVDWSGYDGIEILYLESASDSKILSTGYIPSFSSMATLDAGDLYTHLRREVDLSEDGVISFSRCQLQTTIDRFEPGTWLIPVEVYGITGVIDPNAEVPPAEPEDQSDRTFVAEYGVTTNQEIWEQKQAGRVCFAAHGNRVLPLTWWDGARYAVFSNFSGGTNHEFVVTGDIWTEAYTEYPDQEALSRIENNVRHIMTADYEATGSLDGFTEPGVYIMEVDSEMVADYPDLFVAPDGTSAERAEMTVGRMKDAVGTYLYQSMTVYFPVTVDGVSTYKSMPAHRLLHGDPPSRSWRIARGNLKAEPDESAALEDLA